MTHTPEFTAPAQSRDERALAMASSYARAFLGSDDGKRVLADLRIKSGVDEAVFDAPAGAPNDPYRAAVRDGRRQLFLEIEAALKLGAPGQALQNP